MKKAFELIWTRTLEKRGEGPCAEYRIPGLTVTEKGTLLAWYEGRSATGNDWAMIRPTICRSEDDGETWTKQAIALPEETGLSGDETLNNPVLIVDGDLLHFIFHWHYERAFRCESRDDGITWSAPVEITSAYREAPYDWNVCATGPGHGIRTEKGILIAPVWLANGKLYPNGTREHHPSVAGCIYSEDRGERWHFGGLMDGIIDANETCAAQLKDGRILFNVRNCEADNHRRLAWSEDQGKTVSPLARADDLPDPWCFGSMVSLPDGSVLFANCSTSDRRRINQSVKCSADGGKTWTKVIDVDPIGGYADLAVSGAFLYILYERTASGKIEDLILKKYRMGE